MWVRGLKLPLDLHVLSSIKSHPMWVRGLKQDYRQNTWRKYCRTLCGCVDWNLRRRCVTRRSTVAPYVGAWIETLRPDYRTELKCRTLCGCVDWNWIKTFSAEGTRSRTLCGCVDWNKKCDIERAPICSRTLCGCVDWNLVIVALRLKMTLVAPYVGAWIETRLFSKRTLPEPSRTLCGCVDWNPEVSRQRSSEYVAPYVGAWIETANERPCP